MKKIVTLALVLATRLYADVEPASMFGDHMVLQRDMPVPVWGSAEHGEEVTVRFAGHEATATASKSGKWQVELPPLSASAAGQEMTITGANRVVIKDVLVGEVWVCAGQSNMQYGWGTSSRFKMYNWGGDPELAALAPEAKVRPIRCYHVPVDASFSPKHNSKGRWWPDISGSAVAFGFSYYLQRSLDVPVAVIVTCWGSSSIEGWMPLDMTEQLPHFKTMVEQLWTLPSVTRVNKAIEMGVRPGFVWLRKRPNLLYNAMLHPIIPYACRGLVWYQGEANANRPNEYAASLPAWVQRLRKGWGREDIHVLAVMLPGYGQDSGHPDSSSWARFREVQLEILEVPHTSVANTIDLGDAKNIHPSDKAPICHRLALLARQDVYSEDIVGQGPLYKTNRVEGKNMVIEFAYADGLKTSDGEPPKGFWLAAEDGRWHPADASIKDGTVILASESVATPKACRYAFCGKPTVNVVNGNNLPAYPFRTDAAEQVANE